MSQSQRKNENQFIDYEHRTTRLESAIDTINSTLIRIESRLDRMDIRFDTMDKKIDSNFKWTLGIMLGGFVTMFGMMAHGFHWIP